MTKNNPNSSNMPEEVISLTNDWHIQSQLCQVSEKLVSLTCHSSGSEDNLEYTDEETTNQEQEKISSENNNKLGISFNDWFIWNKTQRREASLSVENIQAKLEDSKCLNSTEEPFSKSCQIHSEVSNNDDSQRIPLQQDDEQEKLNNTKTCSESIIVNKSKTPDRTPLRQDDEQKKLNNTKTLNESNNVNLSKTPERTPLRQDNEQEKLINTKTLNESNNVNLSKTPERTPLRQDNEQEKLINTKTLNESNNVNLSKTPERTPLRQDNEQDKLINTKTLNKSNNVNLSKTPKRKSLRQSNMQEQFCNLRAQSELNRVDTSKALLESNKEYLAKTSPLQPNDLRLKLNKSKDQHKSNKSGRITSPVITPMQQRLLRNKHRTTSPNSLEEAGRVKVDRGLSEKPIYTNGKVEMLAEDASEGIPDRPNRLSDVLAKHNRENSEVIANILSEHQQVDLREKLLTKQPIISGEQAISEETSTNSRQQTRTSENNTTSSSCPTQAKFKSNQVKMLAEDASEGMSDRPNKLSDVLAKHNRENSEVIANILSERQQVDLHEKLLTKRSIISREQAISEETSTNNYQQGKISKNYTKSSCPTQARLAKFKSNQVKMLAEDASEGMSDKPNRLSDVLAKHNRENSEVIANILTERQQVDMREKVLTKRSIISGEQAISEETSTNNYQQGKISKNYTKSSCPTQARLAKFKSNQVKMLAEDASEGMSDRPNRLSDVLAKHNRENSEVIANISSERQQVDLREKLSTNRPIISGKQAIPEETSTNNVRQAKSSGTSSCAAQARLAKLKSNR